MLLSQPIISAFDIVSPPTICASSRFSPSAMHTHLAQCCPLFYYYYYYYYYYIIHLMAFFPENLGKTAPER